MKRQLKNNKLGFTLVEIILVVAIIAILSGVLLYGISVYITSANERAGKVADHDAKAVKAGSVVNGLLTSNPSMPTETSTTT
ncbi:MAG: prepilin-type N-terminal cleavage/methylation domain-containing protein [Clostridia bacterium]|nr:prepilin-type N-terminal cleavage/methylation domain-containing protein [Clostridia bacterium]